MPLMLLRNLRNLRICLLSLLPIHHSLFTIFLVCFAQL
jgi:hypothetical protein